MTARAAAPPRRASRWTRRLTLPAIVVAIAMGGYFGWVRDSSLVAVREVKVVGATSEDAGEIQAALASAAREMTTLHVRLDELEAAVRSYPTVQSLSADPSLWHGLTVTVTERPPVALLQLGGSQVPVAADGTVLSEARTAGLELPVMRAGTSAGGKHLDEEGRAQAAVLGAVPDALRPVVERSSSPAGGLEVKLQGGIVLQFGDGRRPDEKWAAAASVLADPDLTAASYVDLRAPRRPAVGGAVVPVEPPTGVVSEAEIAP